jgi:hypothetical protein
VLPWKAGNAGSKIQHSLKEKWQWVGYMSPFIKKDTSKGRVATVMACHFLNLMVWLLNLWFGANSITGDNNAGQSHGILVLSMGTSSVPLFADAEVSVTLSIKNI